MRQPNLARRESKKIWLGLLVTQLLLLILAVSVQKQLPSARYLCANLFYLLLLMDCGIVIFLCLRGFFREMGFDRKQWMWTLVGIGAIALCGAVLMVAFFRAENDIKQYDAVVYWSKVIQTVTGMFNDMAGVFRQLHSTLAEEYTNLAAIPLALFCAYLGNNFSVFSMAVYLFYFVPAAFVLAAFSVRLYARATGKTPRPAWLIGSFALVCCSAGMVRPVLSGYVDVVGVLLCGLLLHLSLDWDSKRFNWKYNALLALLSLTLLLTRRWYAFYIVGFYVSFGVQFLLECVQQRRWNWSALWGLILNLGSIALSCTVILFLLAPAIFHTFLGMDYTTAYAAYKTQTWLVDLRSICENQGWLYLSLAAVGAIQLAKKRGGRLELVRVLVAGAVAFALFERVQSPGYHQQYLVLFTIVILAQVGVLWLCDRLSVRKIRYATGCTALVGLCAVNLVVAFAPMEKATRQRMQPLFSVMDSPPQQLHNAEVLRQVTEDLQSREGTVYVCGTTSDFSCELLNRSRMPQQLVALPNMLGNNIIDLRDGFPSQAFFADYIVIRAPFEDEFTPPQQVSYQIWNLVQQKDGQGASGYALDREYQFDGGAVRIYRRSKPRTADVVKNVSEQLRQTYPNDPFVYEPDWIVALAEPEPNTQCTFDQWSDGLRVQKPAEGDAEISFSTEGLFQTLDFSLTNWMENLVLTVRADDRILLQEALGCTGVSSYSLDIKAAKNVTVTVSDADPAAAQTAAIQIAGTFVEGP